MPESMIYTRGDLRYFFPVYRKNSRKDTDKKLMLNIRAGGKGQENAVRKVMSKHQGLIRKIGKKKYGLSREDGLDAYLEAVMALVENIVKGKFRGESALGTYLGGIMKNKCRQIRRANDRKQEIEAELLEEMQHEPLRLEPSFFRELSILEDYEKLLGIFEQLKAGCKDLLLAWGYYGISPKEIAASSKSNAATVRSKKLRCLEELMTFYPAGSPESIAK